MKRTKLRILLFLLFIGGLIIIPQKAKAAEIIPVNISVEYGQTEARTILGMINEMRTTPEDLWYWNPDNTTKTYCADLSELKYDYDLERVAMLRAAEIALCYDQTHTRPGGGKGDAICREENIDYRAWGENISVGYMTASAANYGWREDEKKYDQQGHRRNMLYAGYNCVGIGHVYYHGYHYWVEEFAYRVDDINPTKVPATDSTKTVSISVDKARITNVDVRFEQKSYSLRMGESITPVITDTRISVKDHWSSGMGGAPVEDSPVISVADSSIASYSNNQLSGLKEGSTNLTATLYGIATSTSTTVSIHDCKNHLDNESIIKQPTCTDSGEKEIACSICNKVIKKEIFPATGHNYATNWTTDVEPTCEQAGTESRHCKNKNCTETTEERSDSALGHDWKDNGDETATCTRNGCTAVHTHKWDSGEITINPTCTTPGEETYHCTYEENGVCTGIKTETVKKLGHRYILTKRDAPTCESDGVLHGKCSRCSKTITKKDTDNLALGHSWIDNGDGTATCSRESCGKKHTHDLDSGRTTEPPTCTSEGKKEYCCIYANCPYKKTETLDATGHKNKETRNYKKPTCQEEGYTGDIYCKDCETLLSSGKITKKYEHDWASGIVTKEATCKEEGIVTYTCENCGDTVTISVPKTAHDYIEEQHQNATCTENGYGIFVCQICKEKKTEEISATGHVKRTRNKKNATCKEEGYTGDIYCRFCDILLEEGTIVPKLEHQWSNSRITKKATYVTEGELTYHCTKCATKKIVSIKKLAYPKVGTAYTIFGNQYKVSKPGAEVILVKTSKTTKNVTVPAQIHTQGITYKVISIGAKAFNNNKNLTKVTIGTNISKINNNAFFNCKNLKTVIIKSVRLTTKTASKKAFKNAHKKLVIQVPKKVKKNYTKIFKGLKVK